mmetsp:Transcript_9708/g.17213  ORF Transcript_9708/g.17213 Transcript_9708/m.17213 type:complete len:276 (+) Transcript_9708:150-977(+)
MSESLRDSKAPEKPDSKKRKDPPEESQPPEISQTSGSDGKEDDEPVALRFSVGDEVLVNVSMRSTGFLWKRGKVIDLNYKMESGDVVAYICELANGNKSASPEDDDEAIRLAARACLDTRVMRVFAVPKAEQSGIELRFSEGDRVAVQLDRGIWEEGTVVEVWATAVRNGKVFKTWVGVNVPYAVRLDLGGDVMVPFDTDEVIRTESAERPPQKSIADQIGGTERTPIAACASNSMRFEKRQKSDHEWVIVDTRTGRERPCSACGQPCSSCEAGG